jgi:plasmid stabilization system protein ParE
LSVRLEVQITHRARQQIQAASVWWRENRPAAPNAVAEDLARAFELVALHPEIGAVARNRRLSGVRRILIGRLRYHLYYRVAGTPPRVEVLAFWHATRGSSPLA